MNQDKPFLDVQDCHLPTLKFKSKNNSEMISYIENHEIYDDSGLDIFEELKKLVPETKILKNEKQDTKNTKNEIFHNNIHSENRDGKTPMIDDHFLDTSGLSAIIGFEKKLSCLQEDKTKIRKKLKVIHEVVIGFKSIVDVSKKHIQEQIQRQGKYLQEYTDTILNQISKFRLKEKSSMKGQLEALNANHLQSHEKIEKLQSTIKQQEQRIQTQAMNLKDIFSQNDTLKKQISTLKAQKEKQTQALANQNHQLTKMQLQSQKQISKLKNQINEKEESLIELRKTPYFDFNKGQSRNNSLCLSSAKYIEAMEAFQDQINNLEEDLKRLRMTQIENQKLTEELDHCHNQIQELEQVVQGYRKKKNELSKQERKLKEREQELTTRQSTIQIYEKISQFDQISKRKSPTPKKSLPQSKNYKSGFYSPNAKSSVWTSSVVRTQSKPQFLNSNGILQRQNTGIRSRIQQIQTSLNRELKAMGCRN